MANALGAPVNLTDKQFRTLLARLAPTGSPDDDPSDDPSDHGSDRGLHQPRRKTPGDRSRGYSPTEGKRSPKHNDPGQLDDGTSLTYNAWCILLEGKLEANADWWPTERQRINYVFS